MSGAVAVADPSERTAVTVFPVAGSSYLGPGPEYAQLRQECPVARVSTVGGVDAWLVTGYEDVRSALANPVLSRAAACAPGAPVVGASMPSTPEMIISMDGADHHRLRKMVMGSFTSRAVERLEPRVAEVVDSLLAQVQVAGESGEPVDLVDLFATPLPLVVIGELFGVPSEDLRDFAGWARDFATVDGRSGGDVSMRGLANLSGYIVDLIARKRAAPGEDMLSELIAVRDGGDALSEQELVTFGITLIGAGSDTTASQLANSLASLLTHNRDQWQWLVAHPERVASSVEEILRHVNLFATDTTGFHRVATEDTQVGQVMVRKGDVVLAALSSANRDPDVFANPDVLDLSREKTPHLSFGHGIHRCLGTHLARLEMRCALSKLIENYPHMRVAVPAEELEWFDGEINHTLRALPVHLTSEGKNT